MSRNRFLLGLALIGFVFLATTAYRYTPDWFGSPHDDTLYFSSAKSIAEGRGYRIPSIPGEPLQTKYPILYSALLSLVWRVNPAFPENLPLAWGLNLAFAIAALLISAALARQLGACRAEAFALTGVLALHPLYVYWSNHLVSDLLFSALALGATVLAQRELLREELPVGRRLGPWLGVAALLALACTTRTLGVAFVGGVVVAALWRKRWLPAALALIGAAPIAISLLNGQGHPPLPAAANAFPGFRQNLIYYTDYVQHWKDSAPSMDILTAQMTMALNETLKHPAIAVFQIPATGFVAYPLALLAIAISVGIVAGIVARARAQGLHPIHLAALLYLPIVLLWNYLLMGRFWLPFLMLFLAGASHELIRIARMTRENWRKSPAGDRVIIAGFASAIVALVAFALLQGLWRAPQSLARSEAIRAKLLAPKLEAYHWLSQQADEAPVISYDDAALYLYTGRQGMRAFSPLTDSFFAQSQERLDRDLNGLTETAAALHARYWVTSQDDFEMTHAPDQIRERLSDELAASPVVFTSDGGQVKIYDISAMPWARTDELTRMGQQQAGLK